jgi:DNA-binding Lrp family transcriptional regulator
MERSSAIVLANTDIGKEASVLDEMCNLNQVVEAYLVYGVYDIIAMVEAETMDDLEAVITGKVRVIPGLRSTLTLVISKKCK